MTPQPTQYTAPGEIESGNELGSDTPDDIAGLKHESVKYTFSKSAELSESMESAITVTRSFGEYLSKKWYVLSESAYDNGNGGKNNIDRASVRLGFRTRSDVMSYAKSNPSARVMAFESKQTYKISSPLGYAPSKATPLHESLVLIKFNGDKVEKKVYLGNKIIG